jgi:hypothetical protein
MNGKDEIGRMKDEKSRWRVSPAALNLGKEISLQNRPMASAASMMSVK